jgi:NitT/TauT family transport system substrate-binding protein
MKRNETADEKIELARLKMSLRDNFVTDWVKANGVGGIDEKRMLEAIEQIASPRVQERQAEARRPLHAQFLPPANERKL